MVCVCHLEWVLSTAILLRGDAVALVRAMIRVRVRVRVRVSGQSQGQG